MDEQGIGTYKCCIHTQPFSAFDLGKGFKKNESKSKEWYVSDDRRCLFLGKDAADLYLMILDGTFQGAPSLVSEQYLFEMRSFLGDLDLQETRTPSIALEL